MRERTGRQTQPSAQMWLMLSSFPDLPRRHRKPANDDCAERPSGALRRAEPDDDLRLAIDVDGLRDAIARQGPWPFRIGPRARQNG